MSTIIIGGRRFVGTNITVSNGEVVVDGIVQKQKPPSGVEMRVTEDAGTAKCFASVISNEQPVTGIRATAIATTAGGMGKRKRQ